MLGKFWKKSMVVLLICCMAAAMLAGCAEKPAEQPTGDAPASSENTEKEPGVLKIGASAEYKSVSEGKSLVFDFLLDIRDDGTPEPYIIKEWTRSDDLTEYEIKIVSGIKFHDGTPLTAEIVKQSIEYWGKFKNCNYPDRIVSIDVVDDETLKVKLDTAYSVFMNELCRVYATRSEDVDDKGNVLNYNGTGPYKFIESGNDSIAKFERNDEYWNKDRLPSVVHLEWIAIEDPNSRKLALESGDVDVLGFSEHYHSIPYQIENELVNNDQFKYIRQDYIDVEAFSLNWLNGPMTDINLRKAITYGVNRESLAKDLFYGLTQATGDYLNPKYVDGPRNQDTHVYDLEKAKEYLKKAGYEDKDQDGFIEKDGQKLVLKFVSRDGKEDKDMAVFLQNELKTLGIEMEILAVEKKVCSEMLSKGEFDIAKTHPWKSPLINHMKWRGLLNGYDNFGAGYNVDPKLEELTNQLLAAKSDEETREIANRIWQIEYEFVPVVATHTRSRVVVYSNKFEGFKIRENNMLMDLSEVKEN